MKILYLPLDERPCNSLLPQRMVAVRRDITLISPPATLLGSKKVAADPDRLFTFIENNIDNANALVISIEMLVYGGLLPSRLHQDDQQLLIARLDRLLTLTRRYPHLKVYAFNLIMRTPRYDSSDEEPDYYSEYGFRLFRRAWLIDEQAREGLNDRQSSELTTLHEAIPTSVITDYERRRTSNLALLSHTLHQVKEGNIHLLAIPQDDSAEYGYTAQDQRHVGDVIDKLDLFGRVHLYPGADEVGAALIARALLDYQQRSCAIYPLFSSTLGPQIVPLYEDRPMLESLRAHIAVIGAHLVDTPEQADLILAINAPGKVMQESWDQFTNRDVTYSSYRHLPSFTNQIKRLLDAGKAVIVADGAYANGGDYQLITLLDRDGTIERLLSYKGWNTFCNTLGSTLAQGIIGLEQADKDNIATNLLHHLLDDVCYQANVRMNINRHYLPTLGVDYFSLGQHTAQVMATVKQEITNEYRSLLKNSFINRNIDFQVSSPWNRMFEIDIMVTIK